MIDGTPKVQRFEAVISTFRNVAVTAWKSVKMSRGRTVNSVCPFVAWHRSTNADFVLSRTARMLFSPPCNGLRGA